MTYQTSEARQRLLEAIAPAVDEIAGALASVGGAYELLEETSGDRLEEAVFGPVQRAYGRAKRTYAEFAERHGLETQAFAQGAEGAPSHGVKGFLEEALEQVAEADFLIAELQDSMLPVEVGDTELRAGLAEVRDLLSAVPGRIREFTRGFGR
jgi:hypothetical protein